MEPRPLLLLLLSTLLAAAAAGSDALPVPLSVVKEDSIQHRSDGSVGEFVLTRPAQLNGIDIPRRSRIILRPDGSLDSIQLAANREIQGIPCRGGGGSAEFITVFHPNGRLAWCFLSRSTEIQKLPVLADDLIPVGFHPNGSLARCSLSRKHVYRGRELARETMLQFDPEGRAWVVIQEGLLATYDMLPPPEPSMDGSIRSD